MVEQSIPQFLYKYKSFDPNGYWKDAAQGKLFKASADTLNDPFECLWKCNWQYLNKNGQKFWDYVQKKWYIDDGGIEPRLGDIAIRQTQKDILITSLSEVCNSILMWSHYSQNHTGFCIEFETNNFSNYVTNRLYKVKYSNERPDITYFLAQMNINQSLVDALKTKAKEWEYEKEWRIIDFINTSQEKFFFTRRSVSSIILGANCTQKNKDEVLNILQKYKKKVLLYQMQLNKDNYQLEKVPLTNY